MKLGIMQPYFFPYLGYYSLIKNTDQWIIFDVVQNIRHGWIERNRVLKPGEGWQYISVPLQKHDRDTLIKDLRLRPENWQDKIFRQLEHYKKAPCYSQTADVLRECFAINTDSLILLNAHILKTTCNYLGIAFNYQIFSDMGLAIDPVTDAGEWALNISKALRAEVYINPPGGIEIFEPSKFFEAGIGLKFLKINLTEYSQKRNVFEPGLSIIDVMMFNGPDVIREMLDNYQFVG